MIILKHWSERRTFICSREKEIAEFTDDSYIEENEYTNELNRFLIQKMKLTRIRTHGILSTIVFRR